MAWYRAGGGGIPASLKNGMNAVLNKKFGTATSYAPATWPDEVNLMGMLEEKTVSGAVASCSDGADAVPLSSWLIDVNPTLSGVSSVVCTQTKKNLMSSPTFSASTDSLCLDFGFDITVSSLTLSFLATASEVDNKSSAIVDFRKSDGTHYYRTLNDFKDSNNVSFSATSPNNGVFKYTLTSRTFRYLYVSYTSNTRSKFTSDSLSNWQLEVGSSATSYEPYSTPVDNTVNLGQTIYGGQADVVNGTGKGNIKVVTVDENSNLVMYSSAYIKPTSCDVVLVDNDIYPRKGETNQPDGLVGNYLSFIKTNIWNADGHPDCFAINQNQIHMNFENSRIGVTDYTQETTSSVIAKVKSYLQNNPFVCTVPVAETEFTFTPITPTPETYLNSNCFWGDTGDSEVVYRSSGTVTPIVPVLTTKSITENGTYNASSDNVDGYSSVTVNVPTAPSGMLVMNFTNISSPFTLNGVYYGATGAVFDNTSDYIDLPFFHEGMEIEIDVASISLGQNANRRFFSSYRNQGFLYRNSNVWSFYNGSWYDTSISDSGYFDNSTVKIVVDSNNYWHIYKDDVLIFEPAGACAISEPAIGSKDGSCINNATITGVRMKEVTT